MQTACRELFRPFKGSLTWASVVKDRRLTRMMGAASLPKSNTSTASLAVKIVDSRLKEVIEEHTTQILSKKPLTTTLSKDMTETSFETSDESTRKKIAAELKDFNAYICSSSDPETEALATYVFAQEGKLLRPKFAFLLASIMSDQLFVNTSNVTEKVKAWCAVVEMIHNSSLLQDDIIDEALVRRGRPVCHTVYGKTKTAAAPLIIVGRAGQKIYELGVPGLYTTYAQAIADLPHGEYLQIKARRTIESLDEQKNLDFKTLFTEYFEKTHYKTGSLFTHLLVGAAAICGQTHKNSVKDITTFGVNLGLSFQIADDLKDITKSTEGMGKDALNDLRERNTTLPYLLALHELECKLGYHYTKQKLAGLLKQKTKSDSDIAQIMEIISSTKCIETTRNLIQAYYMRAEESFGALAGSSQGKSILRSYSQVFLDV